MYAKKWDDSWIFRIWHNSYLSEFDQQHNDQDLCINAFIFLLKEFIIESFKERKQSYRHLSLVMSRLLSCDTNDMTSFIIRLNYKVFVFSNIKIWPFNEISVLNWSVCKKCAVLKWITSMKDQHTINPIQFNQFVGPNTI